MRNWSSECDCFAGWATLVAKSVGVCNAREHSDNMYTWVAGRPPDIIKFSWMKSQVRAPTIDATYTCHSVFVQCHLIFFLVFICWLAGSYKHSPDGITHSTPVMFYIFTCHVLSMQICMTVLWYVRVVSVDQSDKPVLIVVQGRLIDKLLFDVHLGLYMSYNALQRVATQHVL